ncbi:ROK family protein, partial [Escherichia coli]|uniref:ROK family protein n=1 Tax=Escherichia coli TaxID=562 RepID=UPI0032E4AB36
DAFGLGEFALGTAGGSRRCVCITLGTGVGSVFLADGIPVKTGTDVPPDGSCYLLEYQGKPLEETVSRRAIRRAYAKAAAPGLATADSSASDGGTSPGLPDVREIAAAARSGDPVAAAVVQHAFGSLGDALAPYLDRFGAGIRIVGGSMAGSWDLVEPALRTGLAGAAPALAGRPITRAGHGEAAGLVGAAYWASRA